MYAESKIAEKLLAATKYLGWTPEYHSVDEVDKFNRHLKSLEVVKSNGDIVLSRELFDKEKRWIRNERSICFADERYFATRYAWVSNEENKQVHYVPRASQNIFHRILQHFDENNLSIEIQALKARQQGISTEVELKFTHRALFVPGAKCVAASADGQKSELMASMFYTVIDNIPWWLRPAYKKNRRSGDRGMIEFHTSSIVAIQSGTQQTGIGQGWTPTCLVPDTPIRTADGFIKRIADVERGDLVLTHGGRIVEVQDAWKTERKAEPTCVIKLWGNYEPLECTLDHKILTPEGWTEAQSLSEGDYVRHPVREITDYVQKVAMTRMSRGKVDARRCETFDVELTEDFGYICGFYLAEGSCHKSAVGHATKTPYYSELIFTIHRNEVDDRMAVLRRFFGENQRIKVKDHNDNGAQIKISAAWLCRWMAEQFGVKDQKKVPDWAWGAGREFCLGLLRGYVDGDGWTERVNNNVRAKSICRQLIGQFRDLVASLGFGWSSIYHKGPYVSKWAKSHRDCWELALSGPTGYEYRKHYGLPYRPRMDNARHWKYSDNGRFVDVQVESIEEGFSESFYDLKVNDPAHSFCTAQCAVHNCAHISEVCDYSDPVTLIDEGLMKAMHTSPVLFLILESTGNGNTGWWADKWRANKEFYPQGRARLFPMFLPWHLCTDMFPKSSWLEKYPIPYAWAPSKETRAHAMKCKAFVRNTDYLKRELGADWELPRHQQWFWEFNFQEAQRVKEEKSWLRQMPADDIEALSGKNDPVFGQETIEIISTNREKKYQAYGIVGEGIDEKHEPDVADVDYEVPRIEITWSSSRGKTFEWMLIPLKPVNESDENTAMGKLLVFEEPIRGCDYAAGVDAAGGVGGENSVISVARKGTDHEQDVQACELASNLIASAELAPFCAAVGAWYGRDIPSYGQLKFAIEQTRKYGDDCQLQLKRMGFFRHHEMIRYDSKVIDPQSHRLGWFTQGWSRPLLLGRFQQAVSGLWYKPNSPYLIHEIQSFEQRHTASGMAKWEHQQGKKDDRIFGAGMSYFTSHHLDVMIERSQKRYNLPKNKLPAIDYSPYNANGFKVSDTGERW